jgi:hypothetical protein
MEKHTLTIELKFKDCLNTLALPHDRKGTLLIEGSLGPQNQLLLTEETQIELDGENGYLKLDITKN